MRHWLLRWIRRGIAAIALSFLVVYLGDLCAFQLRGRPTSVVEVQRYMVVPLKGNKQEYDTMGTLREQCSASLFPQGGMDACWLLRRNLVQYVKV